MDREAAVTETTPRREATRQRLVNAAIAEFARRGIDATSVEQLSEAAGFTRGAFYSNFSSKDDLCIAILEHHRDLVTQALNEAFSTPPDDAGLDWAIDDALGLLFSIISPTEDFRMTLMEIRLRALRVPELAERAERFASEFRPDLVHLMEQLAEYLGVVFRLPAQDLIEVFEAVYFHLDIDGSRSASHLVGPLLRAVSEPIGGSNG